MNPLDPDSLASALDQQLEPDQRAWLAQARERVIREPQAIATLFPAVGRKVGRAPLAPGKDRADVHAWTRDDSARVLLLTGLGSARAEPELPLLYRHGDTAERRAVLRALAYLHLPADDIARPLVDDALRTNDTRLIAAALGPYALDRLDDAALAQAVLKCVFVGVPLDGVAGLERRVTPTLTEMLARFVHERIAAGRTVPPDVWPVIDRYPPTEALASIEAELQHDVPERRQAARAALDARATTQAHG